VLVEHEVVVAEVRTAHVPVEILGFQVHREDIGQDRVERAGDVGSRTLLEVVWRCQGRPLAPSKIVSLFDGRLVHRVLLAVHLSLKPW